MRDCQYWRTRSLDETPYVILDARYERVRHANQVVDCAVLVAIGVTATGQPCGHSWVWMDGLNAYGHRWTVA